jgi:predicted O-linked N-acetylglucosamine transferase (SPINDLY family)
MTQAVQDPELAAAVQLHEAGRIAEAAQRYRAILQQRPDDANALHLLGVSELQLERPAEAEQLIARAIAAEPNQAVYHLNHAAALRALRRIDDAIAEAEKAIALNPACAAQGYHIAGLAFSDDGQSADAIYCWQQALQHDPKLLDAQVLLARAQRDAGDAASALSGFRAAVSLAPDNAKLHYELGFALRKSGDLAGAIMEMETAQRLDPALKEAQVTRGWALAELGRFADAIDAFTAALAVAPDASAHMGLGATYSRRGELDLSIEHYRKAVDLDPTDPTAHSALLLTLHYSDDVAPRELFDEHLRWAARHAAPLIAAAPPHSRDADLYRPLRVGFVSADFCGHPVSRFIEPVLANGDREHVTFACYSATKRPDVVTERLRALAGEWYDVVGLTDEQLAARVRADRIDILVDLAGHTARNRLLAFARKPAPIQCTHFGYPDTTGLSTVDYRMTDALADPASTESLQTEQLARLPIAWCYAAPADAPAVQPRDAQQPIVFGSVNNIVKVTPRMMALWQRILDVVPGSTLLLLTGSTETAYTAELIQRQGLDAGKVTIITPLPTRQYLELFHRIDIALDPFPYNGGVTTCDTLWMGVPLVTLAGKNYVSRQGLTLLTHVGLADLAATTPDQYVKIAVALAGDRARLTQLRGRLREKMEASPICNGRAYTAALESFYRQAWQKWCGDSGRQRR